MRSVGIAAVRRALWRSPQVTAAFYEELPEGVRRGLWGAAAVWQCPWEHQHTSEAPEELRDGREVPCHFDHPRKARRLHLGSCTDSAEAEIGTELRLLVIDLRLQVNLKSFGGSHLVHAVLEVSTEINLSCLDEKRWRNSVQCNFRNSMNKQETSTNYLFCKINSDVSNQDS